MIYLHRFIFIFFICFVFLTFPASILFADEGSSPADNQAQPLSNIDQENETYTDLEYRLAQELIATGQMLEADPRFEDVLAGLTERSMSMLPGGASSVTQIWVREQLQQILPDFDHAMANAALEAAAGEISKGTGKAADSLLGQAISLTGAAPSQQGQFLVNAKETAWRSALEGFRAAAAVSRFAALNRLELDYSLSEGGLDAFSLLTVQPLYESVDLRHNVFTQLSFANKRAKDIAAVTSQRRQTLNTGLAYRYVTPNLQHLFGLNAFFDHQWPYNHSRMSIGLDYRNSLIGAYLNHYLGLSDWKGRDDGFEEKALSGTDLTFSGRLPQAPELELFVRGFRWDQEPVMILNEDGGDIWGYELAAEYTPVNFLTLRGEVLKDNTLNDFQGTATLRFNYRFGQSLDDLFDRPSYDLSTVLDRRFERVRRINEIRVQVRQDPNVTARVVFAEGANVTIGQSVAFGTIIITGGGAGDAATVVFGSGAILDIGQNTQVQIDSDLITLITGIIQFTSADGGITSLAVPGGTIDLIGTDVDLRVAGSSTTLRVREGAADFKDDTGTTRVNTEELVEAQDGDGLAPQIRAEGSPVFQSHVTAAHQQLNLVGPPPDNPQAAPYSNEDVEITGTLATGNILTFTVPVTRIVNVTGSPQLRFTLGGAGRLADYDSGSNPLIFLYTVTGADETLSNIFVQAIEENGGTLVGTNGAPMVRTLSGSLIGTVPDATAPMLVSSTPADEATDVLLNADIILQFNEDVQAGTGDIVLTDIDDGSDNRSIPIGDGQINISGDTLTLNPASDLESDGQYEVTFSAGVIEDISGNDLAALVSGSLNFATVDVTAPTISSFAAVSSGGDPAGTDDVITVTLDADEDLVQNGTPSLTLDIGGTSRTASFSAINGGNAEFTYTVQVGDNDANGIELTAINVAANELEDDAGNDLNTTFTLPDNLGLDVSTIFPASCQAHFDNGSTTSGVYMLDPDGAGSGAPFQAYCDMTTDSGGWTLVLNYVRIRDTNPNLTIRTADLPLLNSTTLGDDESTSTGAGGSWGHASNAKLASLDTFTEVRFYCETSFHSRILTFKTDLSTVISYFTTGSGSVGAINTVNTELPGHTANLPDAGPNSFTNQGDQAMTNFPFWLGGNFHWGVKGQGSRWECDDFARDDADTVHQIWVR